MQTDADEGARQGLVRAQPEHTPYPLTPEDRDEIQTRFTYHPPTFDQPARYVEIRRVARGVAWTIHQLVPPSRERSLALTKLQEAVMWANAGIACREDHRDEPAEEDPDESLSLADRLLRMVRGAMRRPGEASDDQDSPGAVAIELASRALGMGRAFSVDSYSPHVGRLALETLHQAGYFVRWERPDGQLAWSTPWAMGIPLAEPGWTPHSSDDPEAVRSLRKRFDRYQAGLRSPYLFALEMYHYGLDPFEMYPGAITNHVRDAFERANPDEEDSGGT